MPRKLPPLNAVRAFDCAARYSSFTRASQELFVTPSAISRHVGQLEAWLGVTLFSRKQRRLCLTDQGKRYAASMNLIFEQLEAATKNAAARSQESELRLKMHPTIVVRWLLPRVMQFQAGHPEITVQIVSSMEPVDLESGEADLNVMCDVQQPPGLVSNWLFDEELILVCSPGYMHGTSLQNFSASLKGKTLLTSASRIDDWKLWFTAAGIPEPSGVSKLQFPYSVLAYDAALAGGGITIALKALVQDDLDQGRLVSPFRVMARTGRHYFLVSTTLQAARPVVKAFRSWAVGAPRLARATVKSVPIQKQRVASK